MSLRTRRQALARFVWDTDPRQLTGVHARLLPYLRLGAVVIRDITQGQLRLQASSLVYTSLLALIPLLAVVFSILKAFGAHTLLEPMLINFFAPLEAKGAEFARQLLQLVAKMKVGVLGALGFALLLYVSASLIRKVEVAFNSIWQVRRGRRLLRRLGDYMTVIVLGPLLFFTALGVTASFASSASLKPLQGIVKPLVKILPYLLVIGAYWLVYVFIPNTKVRTRSALAGATVAGILWQSAGFGFAAFVAGSGQYRAVYASLAILILFIIWTYLSWLILLIGAAIAHYHQHPERITREPREESGMLSNRRRERLGLLIARLIAENYYSGRAPWTAEALARETGHSIYAVDPVLNGFVSEGLLARTRGTSVGYLPACAPETVPLNDILRVVRAVGNERAPIWNDVVVEAVIERIDEATRRALVGCTWRDLLAHELKELEARKQPSAG